MLPSNKALIPPRLQTLTCLNSVICQGISLRCDQLLCTAEDSLALRGHCNHVPIRKGFGTQGSAESSSTSIGPYKSSKSTILRCSHTKGWKIRRCGAQFTWSATGPDLYLVRRIYSILGIRPRHTGLPGQAYPPGFLYGLLGPLSRIVGGFDRIKRK
jgi:hypothetical protein